MLAMRIPVLLVVAIAGTIVSCGSESRPAAPATAKKPEAPPPSDESRRFSKANLVATKVVDKELMGKPFMPGGTLARYRKGKTEYEMFIAQLPSATDAAILLPDWSRSLAGAKLVPAFGGYFGLDAGRPVFVFAKGAWIAGIAGLPEKEADAQARILAGQIE